MTRNDSVQFPYLLHVSSRQLEVTYICLYWQVPFIANKKFTRKNRVLRIEIIVRINYLLSNYTNTQTVTYFQKKIILGVKLNE